MPQVQTISETERYDLIPMALASARFQPNVMIDDLNLGEAEGFASGAASGAGKGMGFMLDVVGSGSGSGAYGAAVLVALALVATGAVVGAAVGGVGGAAAAVPAGPGQEAVTRAVQAIRDGAVQDLLRDAVLSAAHDVAGQSLASLDSMGPTARDEATVYPQATDAGVRTVLEVSLLEIGLAGARNADQRLAFYMRARARLIRAESGEQIYDREFSTLGARRSVLEWAGSDTHLIIEEVTRGYRRLAEAIVEDIFLVWRPK